MKKEKRSVVVKLSTITSKVIDDSCSWTAGKSGICNHVMALLPILLQIFLNHPCLHLPHMNCLNYLCFVSEEHNVVPKNWVLTEDERVFLAVIQTTEQKSYVLEQETVKQSLYKLWKTVEKIE